MNHTPLKEQQKKHLQGVFTTLSTVQNLNDPNNSAWGLTPEIELELLTDIEQQGGLGQVNLKRLCTEKSCTYGEKNSTLRRKIQNQVDRWKRKSAAEFDQIKRNIGYVSQQSQNININNLQQLPPPSSWTPKSEKGDKSNGQQTAPSFSGSSHPSINWYAKKNSAMNEIKVDRKWTIKSAVLVAILRRTRLHVRWLSIASSQMPSARPTLCSLCSQRNMSLQILFFHQTILLWAESIRK